MNSKDSYPRSTWSAGNLIDNHLGWNGNGDLMVDGCRVEELAAHFGTPLYIISESKLRSNVRFYAEVFSRQWGHGPVQILPAIKANYVTALWHILAEEGCGCDVFSEGELKAALSASIRPELISLNGNSKIGRNGSGQRLIDLAVSEGVQITLDTIEELPLIESAAARLRKRADIRLRVRPDFSSLRASGFVSDVSGGSVVAAESLQTYRPGIPTNQLKSIGHTVLRSKYVNFKGLHIHVGRTNPDLEFRRQVMRCYGNLIGELMDVWGDWQPEVIDIGGGFPCLRDPASRRYTALRNGRDTTGFDPTIDLRPTLEAYAKAAIEPLVEALMERGTSLAAKTLQVEPGRGIFSDVGLHISRVNFIKRELEPKSRTWINLDTSEIFLPGVRDEGSIFRYLPARREQMISSAEDGEIADLVGISCHQDRIVPNAIVSRDMAAGDIVAFLDTGAYEEVAAGNFNALPRPATVLVNGDQVELIKRAESIEEVFDRDIVPERLKKTVAAS